MSIAITPWARSGVQHAQASRHHVFAIANIAHCNPMSNAQAVIFNLVIDSSIAKLKTTAKNLLYSIIPACHEPYCCAEI